ncbi:hypothetical protein Droror1_Dr00006205 [Drosera rotundifolia]
MEEFIPQRTAAYVSQNDVHIPTMTVRETLEFSARCQGVGCRYELMAELSRREKVANIKPDPDIDILMKSMGTEGKENIMTEYILKILGLDICADTLVGNQMVRGISGGQRKRLTSGEMLVGPARALFMDEISTGLDSTTTYQIVNVMRQYVHILKETVVISLLQPAPETYDLFDDIILISDGQIVYQGPRDHVLEFFDHMGFKCNEINGVANFLQEVTSRRDQQKYWACSDEPYHYITAEEFSQAFQSFHIGQKMFRELSTGFDKSKSHPAALTTKRYGIGMKELFITCLSREYLLIKRNLSVVIFKLIQMFVGALVTMTLFLRTNLHKNSLTDGMLYMSALYFTVSRMFYCEVPELSVTVLKLPVLYKQRNLHFFPPWAVALSQWILNVPIIILLVAAMVVPTYYVMGYDPSIGRFCKQYLLLFLVYQTASTLFRFIAAVARNLVHAQTSGFNVFLLISVLGGFVLSRENMKTWWLWGYWISPMMYAQNGIAVNEFLGKSWSYTPPNSTESIGITVLKSQGLLPYAYWYWLSIGALSGFMIICNILYSLALTFLHPLRRPPGVILEDSSSTDEGRRQESISKLYHQAFASSLCVGSNGNGETRDKRKTVMILPFAKHFITFSEIRYSIDMPKEMRKRGVVEDRLELLNGVSGAFRPGVLTALMGVSGAGKTTLMDVLAGRKTGGYIEGEVKISGWPKKQESFARISGYCEQNDIHSPHVTVYESLVYSAWLRLSPEIDSDSRQTFIDEVMELLELAPLRGMLVGLPGVTGLSTEQRKRLTIAVELVANPSIIFMDEPTSGLDARAAAIVMRTVRNTVDTGRTVVCTIHQPSLEIFEGFDELLVLKRGGKEIYVGPLGCNSCHLIKYFEEIHGVPKIKAGSNPAAWMLDVTTPAQEAATGIDFAEIYKSSDQFRRTKALIEELSIPEEGSKQLAFPTQFSQPFFTQFLACLWKQRCAYSHNSLYASRRLLNSGFMAFILGTVFWDLGTKVKRKQDLFNSMGSMYISAVLHGILNSSSVQPVIAIERSVFYRERSSAMFSAVSYALAQAVIEIPYLLMQALLYGIIVYAMIGFEWTAGKFFWYLFFTFLTFVYFTFFGMMMISLSPDLNISLIISAYFYAMWNLFSGFIIPRPAIPIWWRWFSWICPIAWTLYGLTVSQYGDITDALDNGLTVQQFLDDYFGFRHYFLGVVSGALIGFCLVFAFVYAVSIKMFNFQKR